MSVKGQLTASRDFLMVGMRSAERSSTRNEAATKVVRACLDLVETLVRQSENVTASQVETTLAVLEKAIAEVDDETAGNTPRPPPPPKPHTQPPAPPTGS